MKPAEELLYDSEASLRLVDHAIEELSVGSELDGGATGVLAQVVGEPDGFAELSGRLRELRSAAEKATTEILDGLARAGTIVEQLDATSAPEDTGHRLMVSMLRDELNNVVNHLQFQDVTGQQLEHLGNLLTDANYSVVHEREGQAVADEIFAIRGGRKTA